MTNLLERCRTAGPDEAKALLLEAQEIVKPQPSTSDRTPSANAWFVWQASFYALIAINTEPAFIGAALMLVPEHLEYSLYQATMGFKDCCQLENDDVRSKQLDPIDGKASCLPLAILAAVL